MKSRAGLAFSLSVAAVALLLSVPSPLWAQASHSGPELHVGASAGALWTPNGLYRWSAVTGGTEDATAGRWGGTTLNSAPDAGFELTARFPALQMDVGIAARRTLGLEGTVIMGAFCTGLCLAVLPPPTQEYAFDADLTRLSVSADVRTFPSIWRIQPFLTVGGGLKLYRFETASVPDTLTGPRPQSRDMWMYRLGAGFTVPLDRVEIVARVTDYLSDYSATSRSVTTEPQHDLGATLGLRYRVW